LQFASCHFWQSVTLEKISHNIFAYSQNITLLKFKKESWDGWSSSSKPSKSAQWCCSGTQCDLRRGPF
jgi:hypothetical protein